jgi:hypothetical protein
MCLFIPCLGVSGDEDVESRAPLRLPEGRGGMGETAELNLAWRRRACSAPRLDLKRFRFLILAL